MSHMGKCHMGICRLTHLVTCWLWNTGCSYNRVSTYFMWLCEPQNVSLSSKYCSSWAGAPVKQVTTKFLPRASFWWNTSCVFAQTHIFCNCPWGFEMFCIVLQRLCNAGVHLEHVQAVVTNSSFARKHIFDCLCDCWSAHFVFTSDFVIVIVL